MASTVKDGRITIAVGPTRKSTSWQNREMYWEDLVARLKQPTQTQETFEEYQAMPKAKRDEIKDVGGFVGGVLKGGRRKAENVRNRRLITLDLDNVSPKEDPWDMVELVLEYAAVLYSTHSHSPHAPRLRLVIPLTRPVTPDEYVAVARRIGGDIGIEMCDDTTFEPARLMYWPSVSRGADYRYEVQNGAWCNPDEVLARYTDWRDPAEWPKSLKQGDIISRLAKKQGDPLAKKGVVGAFCRVYSVPDVLEEFLPSIYTRADETRFTYAQGSTTGGLVIYEDGKFAYSHHGTDPISGQLCNAFDLVRIHLYGDQDDAVNQSVPINKRPSYASMCELALEDTEVKKDLTAAQLKDVVSAFDMDSDDADEDEDLEWMSNLALTTKGLIDSTINNVVLIMENDSKIRGKYHMDVFAERKFVSGDLPWGPFASRAFKTWTDEDSAGLMWYLESKYKIANRWKVEAAVSVAFEHQKINPLQDYLQGAVWDGQKRAETLFIDYLAAEDTELTRVVTRKSLLGCVARAMEPGCKHDNMLVLVGPQGCGKSSILRKLGAGWFSDSLFTVSGKEAYEGIQGSWIIEMSELAALRKAELENVKQFLSKQTDFFRAAFARNAKDNPRKCAIFGTTNEPNFLMDMTGNRRFWPIEVYNKDVGAILAITDAEVEQIWAEVMAWYMAGEQWHVPQYLGAELIEKQEEFTAVDDRLGMIAEFLEQEVPEDYYEMDAQTREMGEFGDAKMVKRFRVCSLEVWLECFRGRREAYSNGKSREITALIAKVPGWRKSSRVSMGGDYGNQRGFLRIE